MKKLMYTVLAVSLTISSTGVCMRIKANDTPSALTQQDVATAMQKIKDNFRLYVAGNVEMNKNSALATKIKAINTNASAAFDVYQGDSEELFKGISIRKTDTEDKNNSDNFKTTAQKIYDMALGYATSGTDSYKNHAYEVKILDALHKFYTVYSKSMDYNPGGLLYGNWWNWEIGVPTQLSNTFVLMDNVINAQDPHLLKQYIACFDNNLRNGKNGDVDLSAPQHTGTNLADITMNRVLQGTLIGDANRIKKATSDMMSVFDTIHPYDIKNGNTDGIYADGSFIQHHRVAYSGSYGKLLLQRALQSLVILNDTPWQPQGQLTTLQNWVYQSFLPLMYEGYMMEMVKGRAVSRTTSGYQDSAGVIESMVLLSQRLHGNDSVKMKGQIKYLAQVMPVKLNPASLTLSAVVPYENILADPTIAPISQLSKGAYTFNAMDKNVQIGDGFAFGLSRSSDRIAKYEYMSGENYKPWFQGDGAFYLYLSGKDQSKAYGVNYFATIDPYRLPGTTTPQQPRKTIPELYGQDYYPKFPAGSEEQNDYVYFPVGTNTISGSTSLDGNSAAILQLGDDNAYAAKQKGLLPSDFVAYKNANANKSWFMFQDKVIVMGSDVHDEEGRNVTTTIDNQMSDPADILKTTAMDKDGKNMTLKDGTYHDLQWINYSSSKAHSNVGYYFPEDKPINVKTDIRTGNLKDIRKANPDKNVTEKFFTMTYEHGKSTGDTYSYVILPNADAKQTATYAANPDIHILENTKNVQAVENRSLHMSGYNFFTQGTSNGITTSQPVTILMKQDHKTVTLALSDPSFTQGEINISLPFKDAKVISSDARIMLTNKNDTVQLKANTAKLYGKTIEVKFLLQEKAPVIEESKPQPQTPQIADTTTTQGDKTNATAQHKPITPDTADRTNPGIYAGVAAIALAFMGIGSKLRKKKKKI